MSYRHLPESLRLAADSVVAFLLQDRGIAGFIAEEAIHPDVDRPSLHAKTRDYHYVCVEFSEGNPYPASLDRFVLDCITHGLPVRLFVALPAGASGAEYNRGINRARSCGVGIMEVRDGGVTVLHEPLSLSLAGVRPVDRKSFPRKYRLALSQAEFTFRQGNPAKGCSDVYDELEALTRRIAKRTKARGLWRASRHGQTVPSISLDKGSWAKVVATLMDQLDPTQPPNISEALLARVLGITSHRNDTGHKADSVSSLIQRDRQLRTRFETATDLLYDLIDKTRPLHV